MIVVLDASAGIEIALSRSDATKHEKIITNASKVISSDLYKAEVANVLWKYHKSGLLNKSEVIQRLHYCTELVDEYIDIDEEVDENDYEIRFNIYRQIEKDEDAYNGVIFLQADRINESSPETISVEYSELIDILPEVEISYENPVIEAQLEAYYSLEIPIGAEQFNNYE